MMPYARIEPKKISDMPDIKDYYTTGEAAEILGFHVKSLFIMVNRGTLASLKVGRTLLISKKSVEEYLEKTKGMSKNDPRRGQN